MPVEVPNLSKRRLRRSPLTFNIHLSACSCRCPPPQVWEAATVGWGRARNRRGVDLCQNCSTVWGLRSWKKNVGANSGAEASVSKYECFKVEPDRRKGGCRRLSQSGHSGHRRRIGMDVREARRSRTQSAGRRVESDQGSAPINHGQTSSCTWGYLTLSRSRKRSRIEAYEGFTGPYASHCYL